MFCPRCGGSNPEDYNFCGRCGAPRTQPRDFADAPQQGGPYRAPAPGAYRPIIKRRKGRLAALILLGLFLAAAAAGVLVNLVSLQSAGGGISVTDTGADGFRDNYTQLYGDGRDTVTVMVYLCGSDLETDGGYGTMDINEMLSAELGSNVHVVLETGGCADWSMPGIEDGQVQRWAIEDGRLVELERRGNIGMLNAEELQDFIEFAARTYPANRYQLIFWDHGGGSLYGYGFDQLYPESVLFLPDIARALSGAGVRFDLVGFDACLMGTIEAAYMLEPYADFMIGSEETEPAWGWDYAAWLSALGNNPSVDTVELGRIIVDSFIEHNAAFSAELGGSDATLSVVSLREIPYVYKTLCAYMTNASEALADREYTMISSAVARSRAFAGGGYDLIDIRDFVIRSGLEDARALSDALDSAVKYTRSSARTGVYGLSMYFPYTNLSVYGYAKNLFAQIGYGGDIYEFYDAFVNIMAGGQKNAATVSLNEALTGQEAAQADYSIYDWYDNSAVDSYTYDGIDYTELEILWDEENGWWYLPLSEEDWNLITAVEMQILLDDGEGYIDLGSDQYYETDDAGNLVLNYGADNTWVAIDGQIVCYYAEDTFIDEDGGSIFTGYVPAVLNGETDIQIVLQWDSAEPGGYIAGYRPTDYYAPFGSGGTLGKGYKQFKPGDTVDFVCDYYRYDGTFDSSYYFGDTLVIGDQPPAVTYEDVGDGTVLQCYMLVDVYQNRTWTETVEFGYGGS